MADGNELDRMLTDAATRKASDLHLAAGAPPTLRVVRRLERLGDKPLDGPAIEALFKPYMDADRAGTLKERGCVNFTLSVGTVGRFRINMYRAKGELGATVRVLRLPLIDLPKVGLPEQAMKAFQRPFGIVIVAGPTGSGKTTTLASVVQELQRGASPKKVVMVEDPIEYDLTAAKGVVVQREVGRDTPTFHTALHDALRQDPDIIMIGELRDAESITTSLLAAETGHLVLTTLHTPDAPSTLSRLIGAVPPDSQEVVRQQLAATLQTVIVQTLVPRADGKDLAMASEVMVATEAVRRLLREGRPDQLYDIIQTGSGQGMVSMDMSFAKLVKDGVVKKEDAVVRMRNPQLLGA